jgi:signal transduction histidine kinase
MTARRDTTAQRGRRAHAGLPADETAQRPALAASVSDRGPVPHVPQSRTGLRLGLRPKSVRAKIVSVLMVPVVSLMALWAFAAVTTAQEVSGQLRAQRVDRTIRQPVTATVTALQAERRAAADYLAAPTAVRADELRQRVGDTDRAVAPLRLDRTHTVADGTGLSAEVARRVRTFVDGVTALKSLRPRVAARAAGWDEAYDDYSAAVENAFAVGGALAADPGDRVALDLARSAELLAGEDALLSAGRLGRDIPAARQREFTGAVSARRLLLISSARDLHGAQRAAWDKLARSGPYQDLEALEDRAAAASPGSAAAGAVSATAWEQASAPVLTDLRDLASSAGSTGHADPVTHSVLTKSGAAVLLGLFAVLASLLISVRIGRGLVIELVDLRNTALELARRKLPHAMRRLRAGEEIDIDAEVPRGHHGSDEIGQVGEALGTVQRAALQAAVERAELLSGVSGVFVNLARRSQVLVHRQLALLDTMERRTEDPSELEDLFRLDHLTTRMRRHAEGLIILSGAAPGRAWRRPVPLTNVVRAAVAEVEDYQRVEVRRLPQAAVVGSTVADLTHLIAELVENATQFSPPHTKVRVYGEQVGNGYALEVEDRGLGMGKEAMAEANRRIEQAQALDLFDSDRLGLFVVSRLAKRHSVKVSLRPSPYGGTTAVVLLPTALLELGVPEADAARTVTGKASGRPGVPGIPGAPRADGELPMRIPAAQLDGAPPGPARNGAFRRAPQAPGTATDTGADAARWTPPEPEPAAPALHGGARAEAPAEPPPDDAAGELPRRVRRANLAPQLLDPPPPDRREPQDAGRPGEPGRSPDEARATMAAYRSGWLRGGGPEARDVRPERRALRVAGRREQTPATAQDRKDSPDTPSSEGDQG